MGERERLDKLERELEALRKKGGVRARELKAAAKKLGFKEVNRGKEPTWEHESQELLPLTIPGHTGDLAKGTVRSILDRLGSDLDVIRNTLPEEDDDESEI